MSLNVARHLIKSSTATSASFRAGTSSLSRAFHSTVPRGVLYSDADKETFKTTISQKDRITVVDFYADWCAPCRQLSPILEKWTNDPHKTEDGLPFDMVKINVDTDDGQYLSQKYKVSALPTVIAFRDRVPLSQFKGSIPESAVKHFLDHLQ